MIHSFKSRPFSPTKLLPALVALSSTAAITASHAADIVSFGVTKQRNFDQVSADATTPNPVDPFQGTLYAEPADFLAVNSVTVRRAGSVADEPLPDFENFTLTQAFSSQSAFNAVFGSGTYTFGFDTANDDFSVAQLTVPADAFGTIPRVLQFDALESVDPASDLNLQWIPFAGGTANDFIQLTIVDEFDFPVFETGYLGSFDALDGTATSAIVPGGTLETGGIYTAYLTFGKVAATDTSSYPGATGRVMFANETRFEIVAGSGGGQGPQLLFTVPANGATEVDPNAFISFLFTEPMMPSQSISWTGANLNPANFQYSWLQPNTLVCSYAGGLPTGTTITYVLNPPGQPAGFKSVSGVPLATTGGSFTTSGTPGPDPCPGNTPDGTGAVSISKSINYVQSGPGAPTLASEFVASFSANVFSPTNNPVTAATLRTPDGETITLQNLFGRSFGYFQDFATPAALNAEFPAGAYVITVTRTGLGNQTITLTLNQTEPPVPQLANFAELNPFNAALDVTARWNAFTGAAQNDYISFSLIDEMGRNFTAPDPCVPRELPVTATSIVVPKDTLAASGDIEGHLTFSKTQAQVSNVADMPGFASFSKMTMFTLNAGGSGGAARLLQPVRQANGSFQIGISGPASTSYAVEVSTTLSAWTVLTNVTLSAAGAGEFNAPGGATASFYRLRRAQ